MKTLLGAARDALGRVVNRTPVPYVGRAEALSLPFGRRSGVDAQLEAMGSNGVLFPIISALTEATSAVEWDLWRKSPSGEPEDRVKVDRHLALTIWNKPNGFFTRGELVESVQQHVDLVGEGWLVVARDPRVPALPLELWFVRPDRITPVKSPTEFLVGYIYTGPNGEQVPLEQQDVMMLRLPNPMDPYRGMGPVQAILTDLDSSKYSAEWNRNFFLNSAEPGGIIEVEDTLTDDEFKLMTTRWREQHQGVSQAHRVAVLERGKWVDRKFSMRDMQFAELRRVSSDVIREAYRMPGFVLGQLGDVNRATAEAAKAWFAEQMTTPRLERWKAMLNNDWLPLFGKNAALELEFDYRDPVPANSEANNAERDSKVNAAQKMTSSGYDGKIVGEWLELPEELAASWEKPAPPVAPGVGTAGDNAGSPGSVPGAPQGGGAARAESRQRIRHHHRYLVNVDSTEIDLSQVQADWQAALTELLAQWENVTAAQREQIMQQVQVAVDADNPSQLGNMVVTTSTGTALLMAAMVALAAAGAAALIAEAAEQGVHIQAGTAEAEELAKIAAVTADLLGDGLVNAAGREAVRNYHPTAVGSEVAQKVDDHLVSLSDSFLRDNLGGALSRAQAAGRIATLLLAPEASMYSSEILDTSICKPCRQVNGKFLGLSSQMAQVDRLYPNGQYIACLGGIRCRGQVVAVWRPDQVRR